MMEGLLFIDKEENWTSRDVCNKVQVLLHDKKVGHTGTLDPFATGLLIVAVGRGTKIIPYLDELSKTYIAELSLGVKTDSADLTGQVVETKEIPELTENQIRDVFKTFIGKQMQLPPMTSAIHINGQQLYKLAHKGIEIDRPKREIEIFSLDLVSFNNDKIIFTAHVSKGTYIRTLGEDIANALGTVGHLTGLRRTRIANYGIDKACKVNEVNESKLISISDMLSKIMPTVMLNPTYSKKVKDGVKLPENIINANGSKEVFLMESSNNEALAIYEKDGEFYKCKRGLWK